jgi:hypothetical protein
VCRSACFSPSRDGRRRISSAPHVAGERSVFRQLFSAIRMGSAGHNIGSSRPKCRSFLALQQVQRGQVPQMRIDDGVRRMFGHGRGKNWRGKNWRGKNSGLRLILIDFVLAFVLIWTGVITIGVARSRAHAEGVSAIGAVVRTVAGHNLASAGVAALEMASHTPKRVGRSPLQTYLLLSLCVAALTAFNLAFWRHLRRAYASPRRSMWRRG